MSALTSGKPSFSVFKKQAKRIMSKKGSVAAVLQKNKNYRLWSLTGRGYLKLKDGAMSADFSETREDNSSE